MDDSSKLSWMRFKDPKKYRPISIMCDIFSYDASKQITKCRQHLMKNTKRKFGFQSMNITVFIAANGCDEEDMTNFCGHYTFDKT